MCSQAQHPSILSNFDDFAQRARGRQTAIFLDYDGTPDVTKHKAASLLYQLFVLSRALFVAAPAAGMLGKKGMAAVYAHNLLVDFQAL